MKNRFIKLLAPILLIAILLTSCSISLDGILDFLSDIELETEAPATAAPTKAPETTKPKTTQPQTTSPTTDAKKLDENGSYYSKDDVCEYLITYGHLPNNFITKAEAEKLNWEGGSLEKYAPGKVIGGDSFGNREGLLPKKSGRKYYECDIDTKNKARGTKRIVFSNDGLIYYTDDHYETFTLLYDGSKK